MAIGADDAGSRNTLVDVDRLMALMAALDAQVAAGTLDAADRLARARTQVDGWAHTPPAGPGDNPFTADGYHALQFTTRQLIRAPDPGSPGGELRFFFPYEVQILDADAYAQTRTGRASHAEYKARQRQAVRARVLRGVLAAD